MVADIDARSEVSTSLFAITNFHYIWRNVSLNGDVFTPTYSAVQGKSALKTFQDDDDPFCATICQ